MPFTGQTTQSIRFRLIAAFTLVGVMAVVSAFCTWRSASETGRRVKDLAQTALPLVKLSKELANDVAAFAMATEKLAQVSEKEELMRLQTALLHSRQEISLKISTLDDFTFEQPRIQAIHTKSDRLLTNLDTQSLLTRQKLEKHQMLQEALEQLKSSQEHFLQTARPRISERYTDFLHRGHEINKVVRSTLAAYAQGQHTVDLQQLDDTLGMDFETLVNTAASEMRANLEIVALTFQLSGILNEAANVERIEEITRLQKQFRANTPYMSKIKLLLSQTSPENDKVLLSASPIVEHGEGDSSIFSLRAQEISLRNQLHRHAQEAVMLSSQLSREVESLSESIDEYTASTVTTLQERLHRFRLFTAVAMLVTIAIVIVIGLLYVDRRVVRRISGLRDLMEQQAEGTDTHIPEDLHEDEISAMTKSLNHFVHQRNQQRLELQNTLISLDEAQQLAQIGHCERNHVSKKWYWSSGFYHIIRYSPEELLSTEENFWKVVHPQDRQRVERFFSTLSSSSHPTQIEFQLIARDNEVLTVTGLWKLTENQQTFTQHGTFQDITDRKRIEEDLLKIRKMESVAVLAGGIAHDFNNLLTGVLGNIGLAAKMAQGSPEILDHLKRSEKAALRARDLTQKLLVFSSGGSPTSNITHVPLILRETTEFALSGSNVKAEFSIDEPLWPIDIDPTHLGQVLQNLVVNADQAMVDGGTIHISCRNTRIHGTRQANIPPGDYVEITVTDTGSGIDPTHITNIFDPYYSTKGFYTDKGSGLGLAIVHSIVTRSGGGIEVRSVRGIGSSFIVCLPALPENLQKPPVEGVRFPQAGTGYILVMDDEEVVRQVAGQMLESLGYTVDTVADGAQLLSKYDETVRSGRSVDCVIIDLTIPGGMGGRETIQELLRHHPEARAIVSSGYSSDPVIEEYRCYGFSGIINKPYQLEELAEVVGRIIRGK